MDPFAYPTSSSPAHKAFKFLDHAYRTVLSAVFFLKPRTFTMIFRFSPSITKTWFCSVAVITPDSEPESEGSITSFRQPRFGKLHRCLPVRFLELTNFQDSGQDLNNCFFVLFSCSGWSFESTFLFQEAVSNCHTEVDFCSCQTAFICLDVETTYTL
jgi:hypothetical protein